MPGKIFVNYRRDDERAFAARVRDRLAQTFGPANVFMDVDNLLAGLRFDEELAKALSTCDVVEDCWHDSYSGAPGDGSAWTTACSDNSRRVLRGGSWYVVPGLLRSAGRSWYPTGGWGYYLGFRVGRTLSP